MRKLPIAGLAAAGALTALALFTAFAPPALAACPLNGDTNINVVGEVIAQDEDAPTLTVRHAACGEILVKIPARDDADLDLYLDECFIGSSASSTGDMVDGTLIPSELGCF